MGHSWFQVVKVEVDRCRLATTCTIEQEEKQQQKLSRDLEESAKRAREQSRLQHCQESQRLRQETNKTLVQEYSYYRKQLAMQHEKSQSDEVEMAKHHNRPAKLLNSQRVQYRKQQLARKQEEALQQEELLAIEERQREQRMERIRSLVGLTQAELAARSGDDCEKDHRPNCLRVVAGSSGGEGGQGESVPTDKILDD